MNRIYQYHTTVGYLSIGGGVMALLTLAGRSAYCFIDGEEALAAALLIIGIFVCAVLVIFGTCLLKYINKQEERREYLMKRGIAIQGRVAEVHWNVLGKRPTQGASFVHMDSAGKTHWFSCERFRPDSNRPLTAGESVFIYLDPRNYQNYYVDVDRLPLRGI